jgi:hypothetical protein
MLLARTSLERSMVETLRTFNIRTVEQLYAIARSASRLNALSMALGIEKSDLVCRVQALRADYPDVAPIEAPQRKYGYGLRLE